MPTPPHPAPRDRLPVEPQNGRLMWVDNARGIGILLVVFGHVWRGAGKAGIAVSPQVFQAVDHWIYAFHMPLFFVLSGLFIERSAAKGTGPFLAEKAGTLMWPYFLWTLIQWTCSRFAGSAANMPATTADLLDCPWQPYMQFWFLYVLFLTAMIACAAYRLRLGSWGLLIAAIVWRLCPVHMEFWPMLYQVRDDLPFLASGAVASNLLCRRLPRAPAWAMAAAAVVLTIGLTAAVAAGWDQSAVLHWLPAFAGIGAVVAVAALLARPRWALLALIGLASLPIYLAHVIAAAAARAFLLKILHLTALVPHLLIGTAAGVLLPMALFIISQRAGAPWLFALRRRSSPHDAASAPR